MDSQDQDDPAAEVVVALGDCSAQDASAVLDLLERSFPVEAAAATAGGTAEAGQAVTVWSATLDAARPAEQQPASVRLQDAVSVTLQGGPRAVERVQAALAGHFTVEDMGAVSGDQEKEIGLRIRS
ncbi:MULTISPECIES: hypothetical protein [unclassified Streptomyces]|uniref:hypothetical protein n=1 Tax=unclassified Streptomyces TaxID=2593676 RepID=UPI0037FF6290